MAGFALRLIEDYALHQLSAGYADFVQRLSGTGISPGSPAEAGWTRCLVYTKV